MPKDEPYPNDELRWAFEIHKDADALLHARLQGFLALTALLAGGFFGLVAYGGDRRLLVVLIGAIGFAGIVLSVLFSIGVGRMVEGILALKKNYLFKDPIYRDYYGAANIDGGGAAKHGYRFATTLPRLLILLWALALVLSVYSIIPSVPRADAPVARRETPQHRPLFERIPAPNPTKSTP